jgi:hypothetical protein
MMPPSEPARKICTKSLDGAESLELYRTAIGCNMIVLYEQIAELKVELKARIDLLRELGSRTG